MNAKPKHGASARDRAGLVVETLRSHLMPGAQGRTIRQIVAGARFTATTLTNGTIDALLGAAADCREVVLLGPSTPLTPEVFAEPPRRVSLLSGSVVTDSAGLLRVVARGGGTRDFGTSVAKINVRVA